MVFEIDVTGDFGPLPLDAPSTFHVAIAADQGPLVSSSHYSPNPQPHDTDTTTTSSKDTNNIAPIDTSIELRPVQPFRILDLPLELRLKIYEYLLPPRQHVIAAQLFLSFASYPFTSLDTNYFGTKPGYNVLSSNFRDGFPSSSIQACILRVNKQIHNEALPVLYGGVGTVFDFGIHLQAVRPFFRGLSALARANVRRVRVAWEVPVEIEIGHDGDVDDAVLRKSVVERAKTVTAWESACQYLEDELRGLRTVEVMFWGSDGSETSFPSSCSALTNSDPDSNDRISEPSTTLDSPAVEQSRQDVLSAWRSWTPLQNLASIPSLRELRISTWVFQNEHRNGWMGGDTFGRQPERGFDSWVARRMVGDSRLLSRLLKERVLIEDNISLRF